MDRIKKSFSANLDALIEKIRTESNRQSEDEFINTRRLTIESPYKPFDMGPSHDIDKQITDLESLIKRLQDEIVDMTTEANKPLDKENLRDWFTKAHYNFDINEDNRNNTDSNKTNTSNTNNGTDSNDVDKNSNQTNSQVFPLIISNINPLLAGQCVTDDFVSRIISPSVSELTANFTEIRKNFSLLWDEAEDEVSKKSEDVKTIDSEGTFAVLKDVIISEHMDNGGTGMPLCNSEKDLN
ncbi:uncharacterized protein LOC123877444 [Maniola jurtina]|uniref:uncharacterized protein LOC123877444 n=1 Tax=Maniola jurtina TaxID=191418 RepID=UPI001E689BAC|nr:uncharacterized protein LOC123877444 [Maniola jurtina]